MDEVIDEHMTSNVSEFEDVNDQIASLNQELFINGGATITRNVRNNDARIVIVFRPDSLSYFGVFGVAVSSVIQLAGNTTTATVAANFANNTITITNNYQGVIRGLIL